MKVACFAFWSIRKMTFTGLSARSRLRQISPFSGQQARNQENSGDGQRQCEGRGNDPSVPFGLCFGISGDGRFRFFRRSGEEPADHLPELADTLFQGPVDGVQPVD